MRVATSEPSGARRSSRVDGRPLPARFRLSRPPALAVNVTAAFWLAASDSCNGAPPGTMAVVRSGGTSIAPTVALPTAAPEGSMATVYWPLVSSVAWSISPAAPRATTLPSGASNDTAGVPSPLLA